MKVVLDSNTIIRDYTLVGASFKLLFHAVESAVCQLYIPEVVFEEVCQHYSSFIHGELNKAASAMEKVSRFTPWVNISEKGSLPFREKDPGKSYRDWLRDKMTSLGAKFIPIPEVSTKSIFYRILEEKKPFKKSDSGFKDFLIWRSTIELFKEASVPNEVILISENREDFFSGNTIHPDFAQEIASIGRNENEVSFYKSLQLFLDDRIKPLLEVLENFRKSIQNQTFHGLDLHKWILETICDNLSEDAVKLEIFQLPHKLCSLSIDSTEVLSFEVKAVLQMDVSTLLIIGWTQIQIKSTLSADIEDFVSSEHVREIYDIYEEDGYGAFVRNATENLRFDFSIVFAQRIGEVLGHEISGPHLSS